MVKKTIFLFARALIIGLILNVALQQFSDTALSSSGQQLSHQSAPTNIELHASN
jgi:hypothetical protein